MAGDWIRKRETNKDDVVIFVHGLFSDLNCWTNELGGSWPSLLELEKNTSHYDIYVVTYNTSFFSGGYSIDDAVNEVRMKLELDGAVDYENIVFVCHSMGGILIRKYLLLNQDYFSSYRISIGLFLIASPSLGSDYANWFQILARLTGNSQAAALQVVRNNPWLAELNNKFRDLISKGKFHIYGMELVEDRFFMAGILWRKQIVEPYSGAAFFGSSMRVPNSDHFTIAKPNGQSALQNRILVRFLHERGIASDQRIGRISKGFQMHYAGCFVKVIIDDINNFPATSEQIVVLPCNEFFDDGCVNDGRSALGSYVAKHFDGSVDEFRLKVKSLCISQFDLKAPLLKRNDGSETISYGVGKALLLEGVMKHSIVLVSTTREEKMTGLSSQLSTIFSGFDAIIDIAIKIRKANIVMPLLGAGHGRMHPSTALSAILLAIKHNSENGPSGKRLRSVVLVLHKSSVGNHGLTDRSIFDKLNNIFEL